MLREFLFRLATLGEDRLVQLGLALEVEDAGDVDVRLGDARMAGVLADELFKIGPRRAVQGQPLGRLRLVGGDAETSLGELQRQFLEEVRRRALGKL